MGNDTEISQSDSLDHQAAEQIIATIPNSVIPQPTDFENRDPGSSENSTNSNICDDFEALNISNDGFDIHTENAKRMSDDEDNAFFNDELFTNTTTILSAPIDTFQCHDDSDTEIGSFEAEIKFSIEKSRSIAVAEYDDTEYRIGCLDLTDDEYSNLKLISQTNVLISVRPNSISVHDNKFNIKRINERQVSPNVTSSDSVEMYAKLNLDRIQFSSVVPLAKYQNEIYFVGHKLYTEYNHLLESTNKPAGTPIRINNDRLEIDVATQTLELRQCISLTNQREFCVIKGSFDSNKVQDEYCMNGYRRFVIRNSSHGLEIFEVEPDLLHSSINDDYDEIYAELDFPFSGTEKMEELIKQITVSFRPTISTKIPFFNPEDE